MEDAGQITDGKHFFCWYYLRWADLQRDPLHSVWAQRPVLHLAVLPAGWSVWRWVQPQKLSTRLCQSSCSLYVYYISGSSDIVWKVSRGVVNRQRIITWICEFQRVVQPSSSNFTVLIYPLLASPAFSGRMKRWGFRSIWDLKKRLGGFRLGSRVMCGDSQNL